MSGTEHRHADGPDPAPAVAVIALSAGGLMPLRTLIRRLPADFRGAVVIAQHVAEYTMLPEILRGDTRIPVKLAEAGDRLDANTIYVCPAQHHIAINPDATLALSFREHVDFARPNFDWLLRSAAASFGARAVAVVLSGMRSDGSRGVVDIARSGGFVIAQAPCTCFAPSMPQAAIDTGLVGVVLEPAEIAPELSRFMTEDSLAREAATWVAPFEACVG